MWFAFKNLWMRESINPCPQIAHAVFQVYLPITGSVCLLFLCVLLCWLLLFGSHDNQLSGSYASVPLDSLVKYEFTDGNNIHRCVIIIYLLMAPWQLWQSKQSVSLCEKWKTFSWAYQITINISIYLYINEHWTTQRHTANNNSSVSLNDDYEVLGNLILSPWPVRHSHTHTHAHAASSMANKVIKNIKIRK